MRTPTCITMVFGMVLNFDHVPHQSNPISSAHIRLAPVVNELRATNVTAHLHVQVGTFTRAPVCLVQ